MLYGGWGDLGRALPPFTSDAAGKLDIFGHDGDMFSVDGAQVAVFEEAHEIGFYCLLEGCHCG